MKLRVAKKIVKNQDQLKYNKPQLRKAEAKVKRFQKSA